MEPQKELIAAARGEVEVDLLLEGAEIVNTLSGEVYRSAVAVHKGRVVGFDCPSAAEVMDLSGLVIAPGFIDGHVHIESSMVTVPEFARAVVPHGTCTVVTDPHEIANVLGVEGIAYMLDSARRAPLNVYVMLPSCVPATHLETSGAVLDAEALRGLLDLDGVIGIAEVMNYPGVIYRDPAVLEKIRLAGNRPVDGHCPLLTGRDLAAYVIAGIGSDHECTSLAEAREKLRLGMYIMLREGTAAKNLKDLLPLVESLNSRRFLFVSDDRHASEIIREGHIDFMIRTSIEMGMDPVMAIQIGTLNAAERFGLSDLGAIAPGFRADLVVLNDIEEIAVEMVFKDGEVVAEKGRLLLSLERHKRALPQTFRVGRLDRSSFEIEARAGQARVIEVLPHQIITRQLLLHPLVEEGSVVSDTRRDILKIAVVERHSATGRVGLGLVRGFGLKEGAIATSVAHDSHNIAVVGVSSEEMLAAARAVAEMGGGLVAVKDGSVQASLSLPIAGLLSEGPMWEVVVGIEEVKEAARKLGSTLEDPFMTLSFMALPVIPDLKLTDMGLVDVSKFRHVHIFPDASWP